MKLKLNLIHLYLFLILIVSGGWLSSCQSGKIQVVDLKCEDLRNPVSVQHDQPLLSWRVSPAGYPFMQSAYRILVSGDRESLEQNKGTWWDSGKVSSTSSVYIPYSGKALTSKDKLFWKVMVWSQENETSNWSEVARWDMGLLDPSDWKGKWIGIAEDKDPNSRETHPAPYFRKDLLISKNIKSAKVFVSGLGYYELYLNGDKVGNHKLAPAQTNYDQRDLPRLLYHYDDQSTTRVFYNTFEVTDLLQDESNTIGVILGNGWYNQRDRTVEGVLWYSTPRLICQLEIEYHDGSSEIICSDETWKVGTGPIRHDGIFTGEIYDARKELAGWSQPGYDDSAWTYAKEVRSPTGRLEAQMAPPDRVAREFNPVSVKQLENGNVLVDAGEMISGWLRIKVKEKRGTEIKMSFIEEMGSSYGQHDVYIAKGQGIEVWEPRFTWHAFRTIEIEGLSYLPDPQDLDIVVVHTDVQSNGSFNCSNELFNKIQENYIRTQLGNFHGSISSDCPHRERLGYTGDGSILTESSIFNFDMTNFYRKWVNDMDDARNKNTGFVPHTAPFGGGGGGPAWGSAYIITPWFYYLYYGDTRILEEHYRGMKHWVEYLGTRTDDRGIVVREEPRGWCLGDWAIPGKIEIPPAYVNTCYYYYVSDLMSKIAGALNRRQDQDYYSKLKEEIKGNIREHYFDEETCQFWEGRQGANVFGLAFGLAEKHEVQKVLQNLVENIHRNKGHLDTGILGTPLLLEVLTRYGRSDLAFTIMNQRDFPGFGEYIMGKGATTLWEYFDGRSSHSHPMYGSVIRWFFQALAGINPVEHSPGFKRIVFKPEICGDLSFAEARYKSVHGTIASSWELVEGNLLMNLTVPPNTTATLFLPCFDSAGIKESGKDVKRNSKIRQLGVEEDQIIYELKSGEYKFWSPDVARIRKEVRASTPEIKTGGELIKKPAKAKVQIHSATSEANIYYTIDGTRPSGSSTIYQGPFEVEDDAEIRAIAVKEGYIESYEKSEQVIFVDPEVNGVHFRVYEGSWDIRPDMEKVQQVGQGTQLNFDLDAINKREDYVAIEFLSSIKIDSNGLYTFYAAANDGCWLFIDDKLVVDNTGDNHSGNNKGSIRLNEGMHDFRLIYYENSGTEAIELMMEGPDMTRQPISPKKLFLKKR